MAVRSRQATRECGQPGLDGWPIVVRLEPFGLDRLHAPPARESRAKLGLRDAPRSPDARLPVAEAEDVDATARLHGGGKAGHVCGSIGVSKDVEQPAVDDRGEGPAHLPQGERITNNELHSQPAL